MHGSNAVKKEGATIRWLLPGSIVRLKTTFLPLGGEVEGSDTLFHTYDGAWLVPTAKVQNFVPIVVSPSIGGKKQLKFQKRRGYTASLDSATANYLFSCAIQWTGNPENGATLISTSRGVIVYTQERPSVDLVLKQYGSAGITTLGTFSTADYRCIGIQETLISGVANITLNVKSTSSPYAQKALYFPAGGALTEITDSDFPTTSIGNFVHLGGWAFIASTDGYIYNSDLNSVSSWTANNRIAVQMVPDGLVGLARIRNIILALGTRSIEIFQNTGAQGGSPLTTSQQSSISIGVLHQRAIQEIDDQILFVGVSADGAAVYKWGGSGYPEKISNTIVDMNLRQWVDNASNTPLAGPLPLASAGRIYFAGTMVSYGITLAILYINQICFAYSPSQNTWFTFEYADGTTRPVYFTAGGQPLALDISSTGVSARFSYVSGTGQGTDALVSGSVAYDAEIITPPLTLGSPLRKTYYSLQILGDVITEGSSPIVVSYSDDNGQNFTTWGTIDMNVNPPVKLEGGGGMSERRIWKFSNSGFTMCEIDAVAVTYIESDY